MSGRIRTIQKRALAVFVGSLLMLSAIALASGRPPWGQIIALVVATAALTRLYLLCYRATDREVASLQSSVTDVQRRETLSWQLVESLSKAIEARDQKMRGRAERTRDLVTLTARELGVAGEELEALRIAAMLADIGNLAIPDHILLKPGQLTEDEFRKVKTHSVIGASILAGVDASSPILPIVRGHHECYDGSGYPDGLAGSEVPLGARILSVADVYCALLCERPQRSSLSEQQAAEVIRAGAGTKYDPEVVDAFFRALSEHKAHERISFTFHGSDEAAGVPTGAGKEHQQNALAGIAQAQQELIALLDIVQTTAANLSVQETLDLLMVKLRRIIKCASGVIFLTDAAVGGLRVAAAGGALASKLKDSTLPWGEGVSGLVAQTRQQSAVNAGAGNDLARLLRSHDSTARALTHALAAPIPDTAGDTLGVITLYQYQESPFTDDDLRMLSTIARQASVAIDKARAFEASEQSALTDPLTGLPNARRFYSELERTLAAAQTDGRPLSALLIDVDHFKHVNDTFGHQHGDRVLREVAELLHGALRGGDIVARYGGDEFVVLLPGVANRQALDCADRLRDVVAAHDANLPGFRLRISVGVATAVGTESDASALLEAADKAMYAEKALSHRQYELAKAMACREEGSAGGALAEQCVPERAGG